MKLLLYCTKAKPYLLNQNIYEFYESKYITSTHKFHEKQDYLLNGKIVAECDYEVEEIACSKIDYNLSYAIDGTGQAFYDNSKEYKPFYLGLNISNIELLRKSCLTNKEMYDYLKGKNGYAIHIKNLKIFDKPKCLDELWVFDKQGLPNNLYNIPTCMKKVEMISFLNITNYVLISVSSEEMCRIANDEQSVIVRKKVLKEMIK